MSSFWIGSILFSAHFLMVVLVFLHPVISQLVFLLHILSLIIQEKACDAFTFVFLPSPPLDTKACQKRDCKFIVVTLSEQNKSSFHILSNARVRWYSHLKCSEKTFAVILFIPCYIFRTLSTMTFKTWTEYFLVLWNPLLLVHHVKQWLESFAVGHFLQRWILVRDNQIDRSWID